MGYKAYSFLTDGKRIIRLGWVAKRAWTPSNNHGLKEDWYHHCTHYPLDKDGSRYCKGLLIHCAYDGAIPSSWLKKENRLGKFRPINKRLINPNIIKKLESHGAK